MIEFICPECQEFRILTDRGALICPKGHGKIVASNLDRREWKRLKREHEQKKWLDEFPNAIKARSCTGWSMIYEDGRMANHLLGFWKRAARQLANGSRSARLKRGQQIPPGFTAARTDDKVFLYCPAQEMPPVWVEPDTKCGAAPQLQTEMW